MTSGFAAAPPTGKLHHPESKLATTRRLDGGRDADPIAPELTRERIENLLPEDLFIRHDAVRLGARATLLECSKNRRGPTLPGVYGFVPGAACFLELGARDLLRKDRR